MIRTNVGPMRGGMPPPPIKCSPLLVNGIVYLTLPDHVWAVNARTGEEITGTIAGSIMAATCSVIAVSACTAIGSISSLPTAGSFP